MSKKISEKIEEALQPNLQGRFHDARQSVNPSGKWVEGRDLDPMKWIISHGKNDYPEGQPLRGSVPLVVVGHADLDREELQAILNGLQQRSRKTIEPPAVTGDESLPIDIRKLVMNGCYSKDFQTLFSDSYKQLTDAVRVVYDTANFPELNGALMTFLEDNSPMQVGTLKNWLERAVKEWRGREGHKRTSGDVHHVFWDFYRQTTSRDDDDDQDFDQGGEVDQVQF